MQPFLWLIPALTLVPSWVYAHFGFFDQMFQAGQHQGRGGHQQQQQHGGGSDHWVTAADSGM